jgi:hypothetical protein
VNQFIEHSVVVTTNIYNSPTGLHTLKITVTTTHKITSSLSVFTRCFLATKLVNTQIQWRLLYDWLARMTSVLRITSCEWITCPLITWCRLETENSLERFICFNLLILCHGNVCQSCCNQAHCVGNVLTESLSENGLLWLSGFVTHSLWCTSASTLQQACVSNPLPRIPA